MFGATYDLAGRLALTRWPDELPGAGWDYGVARERVRQVAAYWRQGYDWHAWAARLNAVPQFTTVIDGQKIHFLHARGGAGLPLLLCHGWPSTPADFLELIGPLAGAGFDLVIPSMPGYGFSGPTTSPGWDVARIARAYAQLMARLGYDRYGAHGGDWDARVVSELARLDQQHTAGIHMHGLVAFPAGDPGQLEAAAHWAAQPGYSEVPTALAVFPGDSTIRKFAQTQHNVTRWTEFERGGHFAALLAPDLLERDLREFFTGLR